MEKDKVVMDYGSFCKNKDGSWDRTKEYQWHYEQLNAEFESGAYGKYSREVAGNPLCGGSDRSLIISLLFECGVQSEGAVSPLLGKAIFTDPQDAIDSHDVIEHIVSEGRFQELLDKYNAIKKEFLARHKANQDMIRERGKKPTQRVKRFRLG